MTTSAPRDRQDMIVDDIKKRIATAVKDGDAVVRDVLRLALGEIQTAEARKSEAISDDDKAAIIRKLVKSNEETLGLSTGERADTLRRELEALRALLPKQMSVEDIVAALGPVADAIKAAKGDGQATGVAMKHLKQSGAAASGSDVGEAVKRLRA